MQKSLISIVAALVIGLILGAGFTYATTGGVPPPTTVTQTVTTTVSEGAVATTTVTETVTEGAPTGGLPSEIPIGALLPLTGQLSSFGEKWKNALELAEADINEYVAKLGLNVKFKFYIEDTKTSPEGALSGIQTLAAKGIKLVVGPAASSEVAAVKSYADANKIVVFSPSSTAPSLALAGDYIFRDVVSDIYQSKALVRLIWDSGVRKLVIVYRGDDWGLGLYELVKNGFEELGGQVKDVKYDPSATEFSAEVRIASDYVNEFGADEQTAVLLVSFEDDGVGVLSLAYNDPVLSKVKWFGTDGIAYSGKVKDQVGDIVAELKVLATVYLPEESVKKEQFKQRYYEKYGVEPDPYTYNIYDAAWILALATLQAGKYDSEAVASSLIDVASNYFGVSGWVLLDETGDRVGEKYVITTIVEENGQYVWKDMGYYVAPLDKIEWYSK